MPYALSDDVSYCHVDGCLIFSDIRNDRYFRLPEVMERAFVDYLEGVDDGAPALQALLEQRILVETTDDRVATAFKVNPITQSAVERGWGVPALNLLILLEVFLTILSIRRQLKRRKLQDVLQSLLAYRNTMTGEPGATRHSESEVLRLVDGFRRARLYVPVETICLLDSLSMLRFLARRGVSTNVVFGVMRDPFAAHCWVQSGSWVLNDSVGSVSGYTPIRMI